MGTGRWRIELVEESDFLPVLWEEPSSPSQEKSLPSPERLAIGSLLLAFELLSRRGMGPSSWITSFRDHPIAFLLDSISDGVNLWGPNGRLIYQNPAGEHLGMRKSEERTLEVFTAGGHQFERRCLRIRQNSDDYVLEVIHRVVDERD
jgi:hypothetical protein